MHFMVKVQNGNTFIWGCSNSNIVLGMSDIPDIFFG